MCGFRWNDIAETLGVSDRTLRRRRHEFGMRVEGREFSLLSDAELDDIVRNIRAVTPEAGLLMVQGSLRQQGLMVQRVVARFWKEGRTLAFRWIPLSFSFSVLLSRGRE